MDEKQMAQMEAANPYKDPASADWSSTWRQGYTAAMHAHDAEKLAIAEALRRVCYESDKYGYTCKICGNSSYDPHAENCHITMAKRIIAEAKENTDGR